MLRSATFLADAPPTDCFIDHARVKQSHMIDDATFENFYTQTARPLWLYIRRVSGSAALADELLQESFFRLWRAGAPLTDELQMKAYLYRIATNLINSYWRSVKRERLWQLRTSPREEMSGDDTLTPDIARVFQTLKPQQRALLWLAYVEGYDHREIARVLELNENSVRVLLFRSRHKLASLLKAKNLDAQVAR
jgi:RNA polymerase sigma-70 factor (ECF subfamily)